MGGARQDAAMLAALGFPDGRTPCQAMQHRLFRHLDGDALAATWTACCCPSAVPATTEAVPHGVAIDGKAPRGRLRFAQGGCPVHAVSAFCHEQGIVLAHEPITAGADQAKAERTVAPTLLARIAWRGRVLTGDALCCQRTLGAPVREAGGNYLLLVKENQGTLYHDLALLFDPPRRCRRR
jgi:hypothetical protein